MRGTMVPFRKLAVLGFLIAFAGVFPHTAKASDVVDRIVANVNGEIILHSDLQREVKAMSKNMPMLDVNDPAKRAKVERDVLNQMVRQKLADKEAERLKVTVSNPEVDQRFEQFVQQNNTSAEQVEKTLKANGQTVEKFREELKKELERDRLIERVLKSKIIITDKQVEEYLSGSEGRRAAISQKAHLCLIVLPVGEKYGTPEEVEKRGNEIIAKIKGGADFGEMAKQYSKGPKADEGGDLGYMGEDELAPYVLQGLNGLGVGDVSRLVPAPGSYYIMKLLDITQTRVDVSDPTLHEKVRKMLYQKEVNSRFEEWVRGLESKAFIQISL
jgi:peptidyl-prolyl cis-trans isomerase SurA